MDTHRLVTATTQNGVICVRLKQPRMEERDIAQLGAEVLSLCGGAPCRLALSLGPDTPSCLYSVFLARLVSIRNSVRKMGGNLVLCEVGPLTRGVFEATRLDAEFTFVADFAEAIAHFAQPVGSVGDAS